MSFGYRAVLGLLVSAAAVGCVVRIVNVPIVARTVAVTSVLIPWNTCGMTQSHVLGVSTLVYAPYCFFCYLSPVMTILAAALLRKKTS